MNFISEALGSQSQHSRTKKDQQSLETKFQLYTDTTGEACQILFNQLETLDKCSFNASLPLVMIVHGWSVWTHILFLTQTTSDLIYFPPRYASAKSNFRRKTGISKMVAIIDRDNEKWELPTEILKECLRNHFSYGNPMPGISFSPGLKPAELEQAAELMCYASGGLNTRFHFSGMFTARYLQTSWKEVHTNCPHLSHRHTCRENFSISFLSWEVSELSLNCFQLNG